MTAIELTAEACLLADATEHHGAIRIQRVEVVDRAAVAPGAFSAALKQARKSRGFPSRARVVLWEMPIGARASDPTIRAHLQPIRAAGFRIERVVNPCDALAHLAERRPPAKTPVAWVAINKTAVAIAVVRPSSASPRAEVLYSHLFTWDSSVGAVGSQARLLQRYSLVAHLAPELRRAMTAVTASHGARVEAIVTCGNVADLRSLSMPLIEELDVEVETLDSLDGLDGSGAIHDRLGELAPAVRLVTAAALMPHGTSATRVAALAGAALVILAAGGWYWYAQPRARHSTASGRPEARTPAVPKASPPAQRPVASPPVTRPPAASAPVAPPPVSSTPPKPQVTAQQPAAQQQPPPPPKKKEPTPASPTRAVPTSTTTAGAVATSKTIAPPPRPAAPAPKPQTVPSQVKAAPQAHALDKAHATAPAPDATIEPLTDPVPIVNTILVSEERRFAVVNERVVSVGDTIGPRVVAAIEPREVVLQEPSGVQIRVGLGGRVLGVVLPRPK